MKNRFLFIIISILILCGFFWVFFSGKSQEESSIIWLADPSVTDLHIDSLSLSNAVVLDHILSDKLNKKIMLLNETLLLQKNKVPLESIIVKFGLTSYYLVKKDSVFKYSKNNSLLKIMESLDYDYSVENDVIALREIFFEKVSDSKINSFYMLKHYLLNNSYDSLYFLDNLRCKRDSLLQAEIFFFKENFNKGFNLFYNLFSYKTSNLDSNSLALIYYYFSLFSQNRLTAFMGSKIPQFRYLKKSFDYQTSYLYLQNLQSIRMEKQDFPFFALHLLKPLSYIFRHGNIARRYAQTLWKTGKFEEAVNILEKEITFSPKSWENYFNLGVIFFEHESFQKESINFFQKARELGANYYADLYIAKYHLLTNNYHKSLLEFREIAKDIGREDPYYPEVIKGIHNSLMGIKKKDSIP